MNFQKILFPTDFSSLSDAAMHLAATLAKDSGAKLIILHVEEPPAAYGGGEMYYGIPDPDNQALKTMLLDVKPQDPSVECEYHLVTGDPSTEIARQAESVGADLIVMGTHGRTGLRHFLMGSVAEAVVRRAHCPVFTFRLPDKKE